MDGETGKEKRGDERLIQRVHDECILSKAMSCVVRWPLFELFLWSSFSRHREVFQTVEKGNPRHEGAGHTFVLLYEFVTRA